MELSLLALTVFTVANASRIFNDTAVHIHLIWLSALCHLLWSITRKLKFPLLLAVLFNSIVVGVVFLLLRYRDGAPRFEGDPAIEGELGLDGLALSGGIWTNWANDIEAAVTSLQEETLPLTMNTGFLFFGALTVFIVSALADWAAFRIRQSSADSLLIYFLSFVGVMLIATQGNPTTITVVFLALMLTFLLAHRIYSNKFRLGVGKPALLVFGVLVAVLGIFAGTTAGSVFEPEGPPKLLDLGNLQGANGNDNSPRVVLSPLVEIQSSLRESSNRVLFTVQADRPAYWRLTTLDNFDGNAWSSSYSYSETSGRLDTSSGTGNGTQLTQVYSLGPLAPGWLPAAFELSHISDPDNKDYDILYEADSATLLVETDQPTVEGLNYEITSRIPDYSLTQLSSATFADYVGSARRGVANRRGVVNLTDEELARYLELPAEGNSQVARGLAEQITAEHSTPFLKALALQNWFRSAFDYDLNVDSGHSIQNIEDFLSIRRGYCEQFAGTYALMARQLGIPSRVAVGFTPGTPEEGSFLVTGGHYHSWPEVFIPGAGWVDMEPTPSRGSPTSQSYTGVEFMQEDNILPDNEALSETLAEEVLPPELLQPELEEPVAPPSQETSNSEETSPGSSLWWVWVLASVFLALVAVGVLVFLGVRGARRRIPADLPKLRATRTYSGRIYNAWWILQSDFALVGVVGQPGSTPHEFAKMAGAQISGNVLEQTSPSDTQAEIMRLADLVVLSAYGFYEPGVKDATEAERIRRSVSQNLKAQMKAGDRLITATKNKFVPARR